MTRQASLGAHVLQLFSFPSGDPGEFEKFGPKEYAALEFLGWFQSVGGYNQMNGTRPQTIAAALSDSPVGQLAYNELFENFGNGTSLVTVEQGSHPGFALLAYQYLRHSNALPLQRRPLRSQADRESGTDRCRGCPRSPNHPTDAAWFEIDACWHYAALEVPEPRCT